MLWAMRLGVRLYTVAMPAPWAMAMRSSLLLSRLLKVRAMRSVVRSPVVGGGQDGRRDGGSQSGPEIVTPKPERRQRGARAFMPPA